MKKSTFYIQLITLLLLALPMSSFARQTKFYVSPNGSDMNSGSKKHPFQTFAKAKDAVAEAIPTMKKDITVYFSGGEYFMKEGVVFTPADGGIGDHQVIYQAYEDEKPVFSGATKVTAWEKGEGNIYKAQLNHSDKLRSLFVNGQRAFMASQGVRVKEGWGTYTVKKGQADWAWIDGSTIDGIVIGKGDVPALTNVEDVEILRNTKFNSHIIGIREIAASDDNWIYKFQQPYGAIALNIKYGAYHPSGKQVVYNAIELLDEPGEFYFNRKTKTLYYIPREGEDMATAEVYAPQNGNLITIQGTSKTERVNNLTFKGLTFAYTESVLPEIAGSVGKSTVQAATFVRAFDEPNWHTTAYRAYDAMPNAVSVNTAHNIKFDNNEFKHIGNEGIGFINDVTDCEFVANLCYDIGGGAIQVGHPQHVYEGDVQEHSKYSADIEGLCRNILVENNVLYDMTSMFYGHAPITAYFVDGLTIQKNHIQKCNYTAVSVGWGWNNFDEITIPDNPTTTSRNNTFSYNRVYDCMNMLHDGGAYYTLGSQPNSTADGNYVKAASEHIQGVYHMDEGTAWYTGKDLVIEIAHGENNFELNKWRNKHDNHFSNVYTTSETIALGAPNCSVTDVHVVPNAAWPEEALSIIRASGVEKKYEYLLKVIPDLVFEENKRYDTKEQIVDANSTGVEHVPPTEGGRYEAELAKLTNGAKMEREHKEFSGKGYVGGFYNKQGAKIVFSVEAEEMGTHKVTLRYAAGHKDCTNLAVFVNDKKSEVLNIPSTGAWDEWKNFQISVFLEPGINTVSFTTESKSDDVINLDFIQVAN